MEERVIHNWDELQAAIFDGVWDASIRRYRNNKVFRGVKDKRWDLIPTLNRVSPHKLELERQILRSFRKYGYTDLQGYTSFWQVLATGQHFGLPTRLLDWSYSPLVAAHFVTQDTDAYDLDGAIIVADMEKLNALLPTRLQALLREDGVNVFSQDMLDQEAADFDSLEKLSDQPFTLVFEPTSTISRIENQYALFSVSSDVRLLIDQLPGAEAAFSRIVIPYQAKLEIRDKLDYVNISERMIYPGLGGICRWIARRYAPLGQKYNDLPPNAADRTF